MRKQERELILARIEEIKEMGRKHKELIEEEYKKGNPILREVYQKQ